jgi:gas vesicle protein
MMGDHEDQDFEPESENDAGEHARPAGFAAGLVVGALLGATIALLYAPERGDRTRKAVRQRLQHLREEAADGLERAGKITRKDVLRRQRQLRDKIEKALDRL